MLPIAEIIVDKLLFKSFIPLDKLELPSAIFLVFSFTEDIPSFILE